MRLDFVPTYGSVVFFLIFLVVGICFIYMLTGESKNLFATVILAVLGFAFTGISAHSLFILKLRSSLVHAKGKWILYKSAFFSSVLHFTSSKEIYAIQIIHKVSRDMDSGDQPYYEMNLIYTDASRHNLYNQGNYKAITNDASILKDILNVPVWDRKV